MIQAPKKQQEVTYIGYTDWRNRNSYFGIKADDRLNHIVALGKTGMGKSTLLINMATQDIIAGNGVCIIDPHGDTAEALMAIVPETRLQDVLYLNVGDPSLQFGFNPLVLTDTSQRHLLASEIVAVFKKQWLDSWGVRLEYILRYCILTLLHIPTASLLDIQPLLVDKEYREGILGMITDSTIVDFWHNEFDRYSPSLRYEAISSILNKSGVFIADETIKRIVGVGNSISLSDIMDNGKIIIVNLSKGIIGEQASMLLGSLLIAGIQMAAMRRAKLPLSDRRPFYLFIDEAHIFLTKTFASELLAECRKYKLGLFLTHQYLDQLSDDMRSAILGNVGTLLTFRLGTKDARIFKDEFFPVFEAEDFINLPRFHFYIKLLIDGMVSRGFSAKLQ